MNITTVGLDLAKNVSHVVCCNQVGKIVKKKILRRKEILIVWCNFRKSFHVCGFGFSNCSQNSQNLILYIFRTSKKKRNDFKLYGKNSKVWSICAFFHPKKLLDLFYHETKVSKFMLLILTFHASKQKSSKCRTTKFWKPPTLWRLLFWRSF